MKKAPVPSITPAPGRAQGVSESVVFINSKPLYQTPVPKSVSGLPDFPSSKIIKSEVTEEGLQIKLSKPIEEDFKPSSNQKMMRVNSETLPVVPSPEPVANHSSRVLPRNPKIDSGDPSNGLLVSRDNMRGSIFGNSRDVSRKATDNDCDSPNYYMGYNRRFSNGSMIPQGLRNVANYLTSNRAIASRVGSGSQRGKLSPMHNPKGYSNVCAEDMEILITNLQLKQEKDKIMEGFGRLAEKLGKMYCCQSLGKIFFLMGQRNFDF